MKVTCAHGFIYEVEVRYSPSTGIASAFYKSRFVAQVGIGILPSPTGDDDEEWERHQAREEEWMLDAERALMRFCEEYFTNNRHLE